MVLCMARPTRRRGTSNLTFRKRVPADVLRKTQGQRATFRLPNENGGEDVVSPRVGVEVTFSLRVADARLAKERHAAASMQFEQWCAAVRNGPRPLSQKQITALVGEWYRDWVSRLEDEPGGAEVWRHWRRILESIATTGRIVEQVGPLVDELLMERSLIVDPDTRERLCFALHATMLQAGDTLRRYSEGDYRPDPLAARFPAFEGANAVNGAIPSLTFDTLFERWQRERKPAATTLTTWRGRIRQFKKHLGHNDPRRVQKVDVVAWKDALLARGLRGIKDGHLAVIKTLLNYGVNNGLLTANPADGVTVSRRESAGERRLPYTDDEAARLLALAERQAHPARRWLPWLVALSGARIGEVAQLWGQRIVEVEGIPVMKIAPAEDGGSLKNANSERDVPIHPALIKMGFLDFVRERGSGPLFYARNRSGKLHASKGVANHLAEWIRENGFKDLRKPPNHAFRHWFKTACVRAGIQESVADAIQGHAAKDVASRYRHIDVRIMLDAIKRIRVPGAAHMHSKPGALSDAIEGL